MKPLKQQARSRRRLLKAAGEWAGLAGATSTKPYELTGPAVNRDGKPVTVHVAVWISEDDDDSGDAT